MGRGWETGKWRGRGVRDSPGSRRGPYAHASRGMKWEARKDGREGDGAEGEGNGRERG
jgi:hypothetical protein